MKRERLSLLLVVALVLAALFTGCAGSGENESESASEVAGDDTGGGEETWAAPLNAPDGFPSDIPVYPGDVLDYTSDQPNDIMTVHALQVTAPESYADVVDWYRSALPEGWVLEEFEEKEIGGSAKTAMFWLVGNGYSREGSNVLVTVHEESPTRVLTNVTVAEQ